MKVDFYIHGVPYGFSYKGAKDEENVFFKRYYENRRDINELRIEAVTINGSNYYYYTYIIGKNVYDGENGRPSAYLGITVRLDQYYTKAQNLYFLLDSFFNSYLLNQIVTSSNNSYKFLVKEFENNQVIEQSLKELETLIGMNFSSTDLVKSFKFNRSQSFAKINFNDANEREVYDALAKYGEVSISFAHPSNAIAKFAAQKNEEMQNLQQQTSKQIKDITTKANADVVAAKQEKENAINNLKKQYAEVDNTINKLKTGLANEQQKVQRLETELKTTQKDLELANSKLQKGLPKIQEADKNRAALETIKQALLHINAPNTEQRQTLEQPKAIIKEPAWYVIVKKIGKHINTFLLILVILLLIPLLFKNNDTKVTTPVETINEEKIDTKNAQPEQENIIYIHKDKEEYKENRPTLTPSNPKKQKRVDTKSSPKQQTN